MGGGYGQGGGWSVGEVSTGDGGPSLAWLCGYTVVTGVPLFFLSSRNVAKKSLGDHSKSTEKSREKQAKNTRKTLKTHSTGTQKALKKHSEKALKALKRHLEIPRQSL